VKLQLLIFLYKLSSSVPSGNFFTIGKYFKVSKANARSCFLCVLTAVLVFEKEVISWPSAEEKKNYPKDSMPHMGCLNALE
jgi:hypothetical protein